jgi:hypothetical protein
MSNSEVLPVTNLARHPDTRGSGGSGAIRVIRPVEIFRFDRGRRFADREFRKRKLAFDRVEPINATRLAISEDGRVPDIDTSSHKVGADEKNRRRVRQKDARRHTRSREAPG